MVLEVPRGDRGLNDRLHACLSSSSASCCGACSRASRFGSQALLPTLRHSASRLLIYTGQHIFRKCGFVTQCERARVLFYVRALSTGFSPLTLGRDFGKSLLLAYSGRFAAFSSAGFDHAFIARTQQGTTGTPAVSPASAKVFNQRDVRGKVVADKPPVRLC